MIGCYRNTPHIALALSALAVSASSAVQAAQFTVSAGDSAALIAAITVANTNGEKDKIVLADGTYALAAVDNNTNGPNGLPSIISLVEIEAANAGSAVIERAEGSPEFRIFHVAPTGDLTLDGVVVRGGDVFGDSLGPGGGGIYNSTGGFLSILGSAVSNNRGGFGGGRWHFQSWCSICDTQYGQ